jgi:DNA-binding transcriptional LysR family regulator
MLQAIAEAGSFAAAARRLGLVPSALTYRVRQIEDALDVLLFDRSTRQARPTPAGAELLREGARLLEDLDAVAHRVRRVATGWEPQLTVASDGIVSRTTLLELAEAFYALNPPTQLKLRDGIMSGTLEALTSGRADLAIGVGAADGLPGLQAQTMGEVAFIFVVAPHHPLASTPEPLADAQLLQHRAVAVADSGQRSGMTIGLLTGQSVLTVDTMQAKIAAQLRGLGFGFLPEPMVRPYLAAGRLVQRRVARPERVARVHYAWGGPSHAQPGRALQWWITQLASPATRRALLENHHF